MDFPTEASLLSAIGRLRAIRKRRLEIRKEDAALEAEENAILEVGTSRPVTRKTLSGKAAADLIRGLHEHMSEKGRTLRSQIQR
nr:MAG TPA: hypothetical protein [Caudoviricetes sp.]